MGVENSLNASAGSKRAAKRARVLLAAKLQTPFGEIDARLRDLSRKGALLECHQLPPVGSEVVFVRGATVVPARVAWTGDGRVGIEFHYMIDEQEVLVHVTKRPPPRAESFRRPGLKELSQEDERKIADAWGVAVGLNLPEGKL